MTIPPPIDHGGTPTETLGDGWQALCFTAMGTACRIQYWTDAPVAARNFRNAALEWLASFEMRYSRYRSDSLISEINAAAGGPATAVDHELEEILTLCDWFYWLTRGVFDPTALPLALLWETARRNECLPASEEIEVARARVAWSRVERTPGRLRLPEAGMALDIGGIGKEYAVDRVFEMARDHGLRNVLVDFGHDIRVCGAPPGDKEWRIGLEDPGDPGRCWTGVRLPNRALASSGDYLRMSEIDGHRYGHILDVRTGRPVDNGLTAVSVVAPTCTEAGVLATSAFVLGLEDGMALVERSPQACCTMRTSNEAAYSTRSTEYVLEHGNLVA